MRLDSPRAGGFLGLGGIAGAGRGRVAGGSEGRALHHDEASSAVRERLVRDREPIGQIARDDHHPARRLLCQLRSGRRGQNVRRDATAERAAGVANQIEQLSILFLIAMTRHHDRMQVGLLAVRDPERQIECGTAMNAVIENRKNTLERTLAAVNEDGDVDR